MNLVNLLDSKKSAIKFSWHGNSDCFEKFNKPLLDGFTKNPFTWKHDDSFPIDLKFKLKFVKFNENIVLTPGIPPSCSKFAFVHFYFLSAGNVEEYRTEILPEFAEWYAQVKNGSWLLIFESTRAREQKARGQVLEKIKSDVSGSQTRIFEVNGLSDVKALNTIFNAITTNFTVSLDHYSNALKSVLLTLKDDRAIPELINSEFNLCSFYWALGMNENALNEFESLDNTINQIFSDAASSLDEKNYNALASLKSIDGRNECPLLEYQMQRHNVEKEKSLISLRGFVLAHQFIAGLFSFNIRRQSGDSLTLNSLNNYFASAIFRQTYNLLIWLKNNVFVQQSIYDKTYQSCLTVCWTHEVFEFSKNYGDFMELEAAKEDVSKLQILNSEAWLYFHSQKLEQLDWINQWKLNENEYDKELLNQVKNIQANNCFDYCKKSLEQTSQILKASKWTRNFAIFRLKLAKLNSSDKNNEDVLKAIEEILPVTKLPVSFVYSILKQEIGDPIQLLQSNPNLLAKFNFYLCNYILQSNEEPVQFSSKTLARLFDFDTEKFPFRLLSINPPFIVVRVNKPFQMTVNLLSDYNIKLDGCTIGAVFKPFNAKSIHFTTPSFECTTSQEKNRIFRLQCVNEGEDVKQIEKRISDHSLYTKNEKDLECKFVGTQTELISGRNLLEFEATPHDSSTFVLSHLFIKHPSNFEFILSVEHEKIRSQISDCFCFVDIRTPKVELVKDPKTKLYAGIAQELTLRLHSGSMPISNKSTLKAIFLDSDESVEFLKNDGTWSSDFECEIGEFESMSEQLLKIRFCTTISQINYSSFDNFLFEKKLNVEWEERKWSFDVQFVSILSIKTMTSILEDKTLFETEIQRCDGDDSLLIVPLEATMVSIDEEASFPADLLNDSLEPIYPESTYRLIWRLSFSKANEHVNHNLNIKYKIQQNEEYKNSGDETNEMQEVICSRNYSFADTIQFSITPVEYEICSRILSEKPQSVICRAESTCDFVISLRMLNKNKAETVIVALEADPENWKLVDKFKVVHVKDNGLGQTSFSVIPKVGYLPYPSVFIHRLNENNSERDLTTMNESKLFGERVTIFNRSEAKQIHVLGAFNSNEETDSTHSSSSGIKAFRTQAKQRLQRLFD